MRFNRASTGERVYSVDIANARTTYQFDKHFLVRFIAQYDSSAKRVLTDLLAWSRVIPGPVVTPATARCTREGSIKTGCGVTIDGRRKYLAVDRGLFFKASYLRRF